MPEVGHAAALGDGAMSALRFAQNRIGRAMDIRRNLLEAQMLTATGPEREAAISTAGGADGALSQSARKRTAAAGHVRAARGTLMRGPCIISREFLHPLVAGAARVGWFE